MNTVYPITEAPLIYDLSFYQEEFKYGKLPLGKQQPVAFYLNAGIGLVKDVQFARNWQKCGELGYFRQSYWAYHPDYSYLTQLDKWYEQNPLIDYLPRIMDLERVKGVEPHIIAACVMDMSDIILSRDGWRPWIYSRKNFLEENILGYWPEDFIDEHYLILAEYNDHRDEEEEGIDIPALVEPEMVLEKQTADQIEPDPLGLCPGFLDRNRWLHGDTAQMQNFFISTYSTQPPPPPPPVDCCEELRIDLNYQAQVIEDNRAHNLKQLEFVDKAIQANASEIENNKLHIADNASFIQTNTDEIEKLKKDLELLSGVHHTLNDYVFDEMFPNTKANATSIAVNKEQIRFEGMANLENAKDIERLKIDASVQDEINELQNDDITKLKENVERHDGIHTRHAKLLCEILDDVNEFELQNNHIHPAWLRKLGLVK